MNEKLLEDIGLTKGEIKVYLTLLKIGETTTGKIIEEAQISAGKIYQILDKLIRKGLVSFIVKEKTRYFSAAPPKRILDFLKEKEKEMKEKEDELVKELPLLEKIRESHRGEHETVLYKGLKGIQTAIFEALGDLGKGDEVVSMGIRGDKGETFGILWEKWHKERVRRKIDCKGIFSDRGDEYFKKFKKWRYTESKVIKGVAPSAVSVLGERVLIFTYGGESSCLSILNKDIAESFTTFFYNLWSIARE